MIAAVPVLMSFALVLGGPGEGEQEEDERPLYYASEVVVVSDRPARLEPFIPEREVIAGDIADEIAWVPHVAVGGYGASVYPAVRGLSAEHVGFEYDGVPLNNLQNGLADLALFEVFELDAAMVRGPLARTAGGRPAQAAVSLSPSAGPATGVSLTTGSRRDAGRLSLLRGDVSLRIGFFSDSGYADKTSAGAVGVEVGGRTRWGEGALTYVAMDRAVPGPDWPWGGGEAFEGDLEDALFIARAGLDRVGPARPGFYFMRQEQHYADSTSEPTHVTTSGGTIVEFEPGDLAPGARVTCAFDHSVIDSHDPLNPDLGVHSRSSASVVANHVIDRGGLHFAVEGAASYTSDFDAAVTGAVAAAYVSEPWRVWVSWGRSYRAPTMNELYWPEDAWTGGNEDLEPERVSTLEAGCEGRAGIFHGSVTAYSSDARDLIGWALSDADGKFRPVNTGEADLRGVELELGAEVGAFAVRYAASRSTAEDAATGLALPYRPGTSQWLSVSAETGRLTSELRVRSAGEVYVDASETTALDGYSVVDFTALLETPWRGAGLRFEGLNIMDERYETRQYYEMPGREWRLSLVLGWDEDDGTR